MDSVAESKPSRMLHSEDVQERSLEKLVLEIHLKESRVGTSG